MKRKLFSLSTTLTDVEKKFVRDMQAIYGFYVIINEVKPEPGIEAGTIFTLQSDRHSDLLENVFVFGAILAEIFRGRGLSGLPKMSEKHYFSTPT